MLNLEYLCPPLQGAAFFTRSDIENLASLDCRCNHLERQFIGKNGTEIYADGQLLLKVSAQSLQSSDLNTAKKMLKQHRLNDVGYGVAPPEKTWVLLRHHEQLRMGNLSFIGRPLHRSSMFANCDWYDALAQAIDRIVALGRRSITLDPGLSNFIVASNGCVYYVDDDVYRWDDFVLFSRMLGGLIRAGDGIDPYWLGTTTRHAFERHIADSQSSVSTLRQQVLNNFIPASREAEFAQFDRGMHDE